MRPNKTNFGLSFGDFWRAKSEGEKGRKEEEEEEEQRYGIYVWRLLWYGSMELGILYGITMICMDSYKIGMDF